MEKQKQNSLENDGNGACEPFIVFYILSAERGNIAKTRPFIFLP
jgi:hypothetical protein